MGLSPGQKWLFWTFLDLSVNNKKGVVVQAMLLMAPSLPLHLSALFD
jgi:hypothetical protein